MNNKFESFDEFLDNITEQQKVDYLVTLFRFAFSVNLDPLLKYNIMLDTSINNSIYFYNNLSQAQQDIIEQRNKNLSLTQGYNPNHNLIFDDCLQSNNFAANNIVPFTRKS